MSLEAIEKVTEVERKNQERKTAAEAEAKQIVANAESGGLALLQQARTDGAAAGGALLRQAEAQAAERSAKIGADAQAEGERLRKMADAHLAEAAEFIVGRVVNT